MPKNADPNISVPPFNWSPPASPEDIEDIPKADFETGPHYVPTELDEIEEHPNVEQPGDGATPILKVPHPLSRFDHVDPGMPGHIKTAAGFKRLKGVFDLIVLKAVDHLEKLNEGLKDFKATNTIEIYQEARDNYVRLLDDLDEHEPHTKPGGVVPGERGYGKPIKWAYLKPTIEDGLVTYVTVVVKWNPHSSSGGKPVVH